MILTNITDIIYYKTNKQYQELTDRLNKVTDKIKETELNKLLLEREQLNLEMKLWDLEKTITSNILKGNNEQV